MDKVLQECYIFNLMELLGALGHITPVPWYMGAHQNYRPLLGPQVPYCNKDPKRDHNFDSHRHAQSYVRSGETSTHSPARAGAFVKDQNNQISGAIYQVLLKNTNMVHGP